MSTVARSSLLPIGFAVSVGLSIPVLATASDDIRGEVISTNGGESGVWVIAETDDLPTTFRKIVVTDDEGQFVVPELPEAKYRVWARGYGLVDSQKQDAIPGDLVVIEANEASSPLEAASVFPANYWYSLLRVPSEKEFPGTGTGEKGNGISEGMRTQGHYIDRLKEGCQLCHQMGTQPTRDIPEPNDYDSSRHAWDERVKLGGGAGAQMNAVTFALGRERALDMFTNWTDRIAKGEVPDAPPRPDGVQQNLVLTQWGWSNENGFVHDNVTTDKRNPTLYSNGSAYGVSQNLGTLTVTDPNTNTSRSLDIPMRGGGGPGSQSYGTSHWSNPHNPMFDDKNRVWMTSSVRGRENPDWCRSSDHPSVKRFPIGRSDRQLSYYDVEAEEFVLIDTCYGTHHLQFADDENDTLWLSGDVNVVGWLDTTKYDETGDERASQGWCPTILDTNGDGELGEYVEPNQPVDPTKDKRLFGFAYGIIPHPSDGSIWFVRTYPSNVPGQILRLDPKTCLTEQYHPPYKTDAVPPDQWGYTPRGIDVDRNGLIWTALSGSGHIASFDRSKCEVLNGPTATGHHCPEGWTLYPTPGPQMQGVTASGSADFHYYIWVDQFNTLGLGENVPIANGTTSDSLIALLPERGETVPLRVPYPLGFFTRGLDGRIDDAEAGWKGRSVWASNNSVVVWHNEGGRGMTSEIVRFQVRPDPLAD